MQKMKSAVLIVVILLILTGCSIGEESTEWMVGKANDTLEVIGGGVQEVIDSRELPILVKLHRQTRQIR